MLNELLGDIRTRDQAIGDFARRQHLLKRQRLGCERDCRRLGVRHHYLHINGRAKLRPTLQKGLTRAKDGGGCPVAAFWISLWPSSRISCRMPAIRAQPSELCTTVRSSSARSLALGPVSRTPTGL